MSLSGRTAAPAACKRCNAVKAMRSARGVTLGASLRRASSVAWRDEFSDPAVTGVRTRVSRKKTKTNPRFDKNTPSHGRAKPAHGPEEKSDVCDALRLQKDTGKSVKRGEII